jgi:perosamine synthetase
VIEDAARRTGRDSRGKKVGTWGDCAAFSFNQNKCLCSGEGGMFTTDDEELFRSARQLWSFGETRSPAESRDYHAYALGWMYRNNDLTGRLRPRAAHEADGYLEAQRENGAVLNA